MVSIYKTNYGRSRSNESNLVIVVTSVFYGSASFRIIEAQCILFVPMLVCAKLIKICAVDDEKLYLARIYSL